MEYYEPLPMSRAELEASIESGNQTAITEALLSAAFFDPDWRWVQGICLRFLDHTDSIVRWYAACCIGHIARIHEVLDLDLVLPKLVSLKTDAAIGPYIEEVMEDIRRWIRLQ